MRDGNYIAIYLSVEILVVGCWSFPSSRGSSTCQDAAGLLRLASSRTLDWARSGCTFRAARFGEDPRDSMEGCRGSSWLCDWLLRREDLLALGGLLFVGVTGRSGLLLSSRTVEST